MSIWTDLQAEIRERFGLMDDWEMWEREMRWTGWVELACHHRDHFFNAAKMPQPGDAWFCATCDRSWEITKTTGRGA